MRDGGADLQHHRLAVIGRDQIAPSGKLAVGACQPGRDHNRQGERRQAREAADRDRLCLRRLAADAGEQREQTAKPDTDGHDVHPLCEDPAGEPPRGVGGRVSRRRMHGDGDRCGNGRHAATPRGGVPDEGRAVSSARPATATASARQISARPIATDISACT